MTATTSSSTPAASAAWTRSRIFSTAAPREWWATSRIWSKRGRGAPDDLRPGHLTQEWLATSDDPEALTSGGYWHHRRRQKAHPAVHDEQFQDALLAYPASLSDERFT